MAIEGRSDAASGRLRLGMVGGGKGAFIGAVHRLAARMDDKYEFVAGALSSEPARSRASGRELGLAKDRIYTDYFLEKGDFFRIDNITLGHTFDKLWNEKTSLRLSFTVQNVCTLTGYSGLDAEIYSGIDQNLYQRPRMFMLGVNLNF